MDRTQEYLEKIRQAEGLKNAVLGGITFVKRTQTAEFSLITDKAYTQEEVAGAESVTACFLPSGVSAKVKVIKRVPDEELLKKCVFEYLQKTFPAASAYVKQEDIEIELLGSGAKFRFLIASGDQPFFSSGRILDSVSAYLQTVFCGAFIGDVKIVEKEREELDLNEIEETEEETFIKEIRKFPIQNFKKLDGADFLPTEAVYTADVSLCEGQIVVCGSVAYIEERKYVKHNEKTNEDVEKSRFSITITDGSASLRTTYFPKKGTVDKVREIKQGDFLVLIGENEEYNGNRSFRTGKINFGSPPEGFEPIAKKSKSVPKFYHAVFPEEYVDYTQAGLFDSLSIPSDLKKGTFVVFDVETTGLNHQPAMGKMDKIIEIGAVKIVNGEMREKFSSFVACKDKLPQHIVELTGITDDDLVGAPEIEQVIADFFKFTDGCRIVGHNVQFDLDFVRYYGAENGYHFDHKAYDTLTMAQQLLRSGEVSNYKLNTIADYYGFTFDHHRAYSDAAVTAKVFIELVKKKGCLPD